MKTWNLACCLLYFALAIIAFGRFWLAILHGQDGLLLCAAILAFGQTSMAYLKEI